MLRTRLIALGLLMSASSAALAKPAAPPVSAAPAAVLPIVGADCEMRGEAWALSANGWDGRGKAWHSCADV